jgi:hypothetical protein
MEVSIMTVRTFARMIGIAAVLWCAALFPREADACAVSWSDTNVSGGSYISTEALVEDYYGSEPCGSFYPGFYHEYYISIQMSCGTQYSEGGDVTTAYGGGGSLYTYVNVTATETVVCDIQIYMVIWCSALYAPILEVTEFQQAPVVSLKANGANCPITLTRGAPIALTLDAPSPYDINWSFSGGGGSVTKAGDTTWGGTMAVSGTANVTFRVPNYQPLLDRSCSATVNARPGWSTPDPPTENDTNFATFGTNWASNPPPLLGQSGVVYGTPTFNGTAAQIGSGPNTGYFYHPTGSLSFSNYKFKWVIHPDVNNTNSQFGKCQTGPQGGYGVIDINDLRTNDIRHESSSTGPSHYKDFKTKNAATTLNLGSRLEARVAPPGTANFTSSLGTDISSWISALDAAYLALPDPASPQHDANGNLLGTINLPDAFGNWAAPCNP